MPTWVWIVIAIAAVVVLAAIAWSAYSSRRRKGLQERFGSEYDRTVADAPSKREAESELAERQKRRDELEIRPLEQRPATGTRASGTTPRRSSSTTRRARSATPIA